MLKVNDVRDLFYSTEPNEFGMVEVLGVAFEADEPSVFGAVDTDRELLWHKSQDLNIAGLGADAPTIWKHIAGDNGEINSNYGWCVFSKENGYQFDNVVKELSFNPHSQRGVMIYTRPSMHSDYSRNGMNDFINTNAVNYYVEGDTLVGVVQMKSNDIVYGYQTDYAWQKYIIDKLAAKIGISDTKLIWQVGSLQMYPQHVEEFLWR